jgi:hypothetical protein
MPPHVYDGAKVIDDSVSDLGLPEEHAANHTAFFLRWLIERSLVSAAFESDGAEVLAAFRGGRAAIHDVYDWWDRCLVDEMLSETGNAFARSYFDFERGDYLSDYARVLQRDLPSEYHVAFTEANYQTIGAVLDARYAEWQRGARG